jgi:hypothetical protein
MRSSQSPQYPSIFESALPFYTDRLDVASLSENGRDFGKEIIRALRQPQFSLVFDAPPSEAAFVKHLFFEHRNREKITGSPALGLGFPILSFSSDKQNYAAPLFIFPLQLEPLPDRPNRWMLKRLASIPVFLNPFLSELQPDWLADLPLHKSDWELSEIAGVIEALQKRASDEEMQTDDWYDVIPFPGIDRLDQVGKEPELFISGVIGLYPASPYFYAGSKQKEERQPLQQTACARNTEQHPFGSFHLHPREATAYKNALQNRYTHLSCRANPSKNPVIRQILTNAFSNGDQVLIVSDKIEPLSTIQQTLEQLPVQVPNFLITNPWVDKNLLLDLLRNRADRIAAPSPAPASFNLTTGKCLRHFEKLEKAYQALHQPLLGEDNWTELVGRFLYNQRLEGKELLSSQLQAEDFEWKEEEHPSLSKVIRDCYPLFQPINTLKHPLTVLHSSIFELRNEKEAAAYVGQQLQLHLDQLKTLQQRFMQRIDVYTARLYELYENYYQKFSRHIDRIKNLTADHSNHFGKEFEDAASLGLKRLFSSRARQIKEAREEVAGSLEELRARFSSKSYFDFEFSPIRERQKVNQVAAQLEQFEDELNKWRLQIPNQVQEELLRLNRKNAHPELELSESVGELEDQLEESLEALNLMEVFAVPFSHKMLTIPKKLRYLENTIEHLENTQLSMRDFQAFYHWQKKWLSLDPLQKKLITALIRVNAKDWNVAFNSWYFHQYLSHHYTDDLPSSNESLEAFAKNLSELISLLPQQANHLASQNRNAALRKAKRHKKQVFQRLFSKNNKSVAAEIPFSQLFAEGIHEISAFYPCLLMTAASAAQLLKEVKESFEWIILLESDHLSSEGIRHFLDAGKRILFVTHEGLRTPSDLELFLHHHTDIIRHALPITTPAPGASQFWPEVHIENVNGQFDEMADTNETEAQQIVTLLNSIQKTPQRTYPSVGIVTFTVNQRDLIASYLQQIKHRNAAAAETIAQLERNGLMVLCVDELIGLSFDQLFISATFGPVDASGSITRELRQMESLRGQKAMKHLLFTRPALIRMIHSLPDGFMAQLAEKTSSNSAFHWWDLYLKQLDLFQRQDLQGYSDLQDQLLPSEPEEAPNSVFIEMVEKEMEPYFGLQRLYRNIPFEDTCLPLSVAAQHQPQEHYLLHTDLFFAHTPYTSFRWEFDKLQALKKANYRILPIWSVNWWKDPVQEARKLTGDILQLDQPPASSEEEE